MYGHQLGSMMGSGYAMFWMAIWTVILIGIAALVIGLILRSSRNSQSDGEPSLEILKRRYARGEIDHDEYQQRLEELRR